LPEGVRSAPFVPADAVGNYGRAFAAGAAAALLDHEDAVAPSVEDAARATPAESLDRPVALRDRRIHAVADRD
jgi:citrate lyase beta subunit